MRPVPLRRSGFLIGLLVLLVGCGGSGGSSTPSVLATPPSSTRATTDPNDIVQAGAERLTVPGGLDWIVVAGGSAWAASGSLTRLDGATGVVLSTLALSGGACLAPDVGYDSLWVAVCQEGSPHVVRVDPISGQVVATIPVRAANFQGESSVGAGAGLCGC